MNYHTVNYYIEVTDGNAQVKAESGVILQPSDQVTFTSNDANAAIQYTETSPFAEIPAGKPFLVGLSAGPFTVVDNPGEHHFDCGKTNGGGFSPWGQGGNTPSLRGN